MRSIPAKLRRLVLHRAAGRCEYCRLAQQGQEATFHVDHIKPVTEDGPTTTENLALACVSCSLRKAAREMVPDPDTGREVRLFNPRRERWQKHFRWEDEKFLLSDDSRLATFVEKRGISMATPTEQIEEFRERMQEVDLPTLLAFDRELHRLLELKKETQPQAAQPMTAQEEFRQQFPRLKVDPELFALVGIHPATPVEEDKALIRAQIFRRLSE